VSQLGKKYNKRKLQTSYISTVVGVSLVLTMLGMVLAIILGLSSFKNSVKENIQVDLFFEADVSEADIKLIAEELNTWPEVKSASFVSAERAWEEFQQLTESTGDSLSAQGLDLSVIDGDIPIPPSVSFHPKAKYANLESMNQLEKKLFAAFAGKLSDFNLNKSSLQDVNIGFDRIAYMILMVAGLLLIISFAMINNTIRLALYSKRFIIKTMQLVGATGGFIRKPFILQSVIQGLFSAIFGISLLLSALYFTHHFYLDLSLLVNLRLLLALFAFIVIMGVIISVVATIFALNKYLKMKLDDLY
jgi:cell division transport system permease protein